MDILLSVRKEYLDKILSGEKTLEIRKNAPKQHPGRIWLYESGRRDGEKRIVGSCWLRGCIVVDGRYDSIRKASCLTEDELKAYSGGRKLYGWELVNVKQFIKPIPLERFHMKHPPQSWCYIKSVEV